MKKKNLYILIVLAVLVIIGFIIWWLNTSKKEINPEHVRLNFIIYHENPIAGNDGFIKNDFLKPLLQSKVNSNANGTEDLIISSVEVRGLKFCIPAQGINILRYDEKTPLNQTNYTSTSRISDEDSFFETWEGGEKFDKIISLLKSVDTKLKLPSANLILNQQKSRFVDSLIICLECSEDVLKMNSPFVYKSLTELRKFVNKQIESFQNAIDEKGVNNSIKVFIYKNLNQLLVTQGAKDTDGDGVPDNIDGCPEEKGSKELKGCPDDDGDGVPNNVDQCPNEKGEPSSSGCPFIEPCPTGDKDKDGICDSDDNCPDDFGQRKYGGCPPDRDGDGIWDKFDKCPDEKGLKKLQGCPDNDGDNVPDYQDQCPNEKGTVNCNGCICTDEEPPKPILTIGLSGSKFQINGVSIRGEYTAKLIAKGQFKTKEFSFNGAFCPANTSESKSMSQQIDTDDLTVTIIVFKNGKEIEKKSFSGLSYVCFSNNDCGFLKD